ncbi:MAG: 50S ribosomal protein L10, partial [Candidatus Omnitrophica bacterium]|nr:50S ribosomal protein L10 [Candidatus Omnitrophota bacterium]
MKKVSLIFKETSHARITKEIKNSNSVFIINYLGLSSPDFTSLRKNLKTSNASLFVVKNSVARRALHEVGMEALISLVDGPCGLVFSKDE